MLPDFATSNLAKGFNPEGKLMSHTPSCSDECSSQFLHFPLNGEEKHVVTRTDNGNMERSTVKEKAELNCALQGSPL